MNKKTSEAMFSSKDNEWFTPMHIYKPLDNKFHFTTDPCTDARNPLGCKVFYTKEDNGLDKPWYGNVFVNPPYGRAVDKWVPKCAEYAASGSGTVVMLIAARTDTKRFHKYIWDADTGKPRANVTIDFIKSRIKFLTPEGKTAKNPAFPSMVVVFHHNNHTTDDRVKKKSIIARSAQQ